jgi:hypothetical protein
LLFVLDNSDRNTENKPGLFCASGGLSQQPGVGRPVLPPLIALCGRRSLYYIEEEWNRGPTKVLG